MTPRIMLMLVAAAIFASPGMCAAESSDALEFYGFDGASYSETASQGLQEIFSGKCFHQAIPLVMFRMATRAQSSKQNELGYDPNTTEGKFYTAGRLPSPPDREDGAGEDIGLGESTYVRDGLPVATINCFSCHAGVVNGEVVAGLGNSHIDQSDPNRRRTRGDNFGPYGVWRLGAQLDDPANKGLVISHAKTELVSLLESMELPPVDPMPWWLMKYKERDYWYADGGVDDAAHFSFNFTTSDGDMNARHAAHVETVAKALAFARETTSPPFPGDLDAAFVQKGADLFHGRVKPTNAQGFVTCTTCHGSYSRKAEHGDLSKPGGWQVDYNRSHVLRDVKTDSAYNTVLRTLAPIADHINKLEVYYTSKGTPELTPRESVPKKSGYVAPPLVGVWASAPYFHNGSVPTLETVLNSAKRPEIWSRPNDNPHAYNLDEVGMQYEAVSRSDYGASAAKTSGQNYLSKAAVDHGSLYDTTTYGHANTGHTFGDQLTQDERKAVIEFLKSLSGPDM